MSMGDAHIYLTVPFVLSWSLMNSLSCGCTVIGSDTAPVQEMIQHGHNGLLADFFDVDALTAHVLSVLDAPEQFQHLGKNGTAMIRDQYSLTKMLPRMLEFYQSVVQGAFPV